VLIEAGLKPATPQGSFFTLTDVSALLKRLPAGYGRRPDQTITGLYPDLADWNFSRWLTSEVGVTVIPCSAFYYGSERPTNMVRWAFCKREDDIVKGGERLKKLESKLLPVKK